MKAEIRPKEFSKLMKLVTKGVRGNKVRSKAIGLLFFKNDRVELEFNDIAGSCEANVTEWGTYALNPITFNALLAEFTDEKVVVEIDERRVQIGNLKLDHKRLNGFWKFPRLAIRVWNKYIAINLAKKIKRREQEEAWEQWNALNKEEFWTRRKVVFKRTDGGIESGAAIIDWERGAYRNRRVLIKTKDFREVWISEMEIVDFDYGDSLDF